MKKLSKIIVACFSVALILGIYSCTSDTEYLKFTEGGEVSYTGAIDSLKIFTGKNRVKVQGLIIGDPKVTEVRVYWNSNKDSISIPVNRTANVDEVSAIIDGLEENIFNFVVRTFDAEGNSSIAVSQTAEVYGDRYIASLYNRPLEGHFTVGSDFVIILAEMDLNTGVLGSEIEYTNSAGELKSVYVDISESRLTLTDFVIGNSYRYRTDFIPEEGSIDNFYANYEEVIPIPLPLLSNSSIPFKASVTDGGRWGTLADPWITNDAAKNHGGYGGWDEWNGNVFNLESGWEAPSITNGKIYQVITAIPGTYQLKVTLLSSNPTNHSINDEGGAYFVVAKGNTGLPDVEDLTTSSDVLSYKRILGSSSINYVVDFTVDEVGEFSVGELTTQSDAGRFANIVSWNIVRVN